MSVLSKTRGVMGDAVRWASGMRRGSWWSELLSPAPRAARFYVHTWLDWVSGRARGSDVPTPRPHPLVLLEATLDELLLATFKIGRPPRHDDAYWRIIEEATVTAEVFEAHGFHLDPMSFWGDPEPFGPPVLRRRRLGARSYEHLSWASGFEPHPGVPGADRWRSYTANATTHAYVLRHDEPAPWLLCLPGTGMGFSRADFRTFPPEWLHDQLGLNVVIPVAPLHGPRRRQALYGLGFPTDDLVDTVHGISQAVWDTRRMLGWIHSQSDTPIGMTGISLGGYLTAAVANLEDDLACVIAGVPPVDFPALFEAHTPKSVRGTPLYDALNSVAGRLFHVVSPLVLDPKPGRDRRFIYAGTADRLINPHRQALRLWNHWEQPRINWYAGSHLGFMWSRPVREFIGDALIDTGLVVDTHLEAA
ncbi:MAG: S9 family peptidase [Acidimicrobiia bacterium]|nr:S9 family peptidase [Acidimicrobiia bacterium]